jgi:hypothetical protein
MRVVFAFALVVVVATIANSGVWAAQDMTVPSTDVIEDASIPVPTHTVTARTMKTVPLMSPAELKAIADKAAARLATKQKIAREKRAAKKAKALAAAKHPGAASKAITAAKPKAPRDELIKWVRSHLIGVPEAEYVKIHQYLKGQVCTTNRTCRVY